MKKAKYNEVPKEYRRNYKEEAKKTIGIILSGIAFGAVLLLITMIGLR